MGYEGRIRLSNFLGEKFMTVSHEKGEMENQRKRDSVRLRNDHNSQLMNKVLVSREVTFIQRKEAKRRSLKLEA